MHNLERRVENLERDECIGELPWVQIIVDEGDDVDAAAEEASYDPEKNNLMILQIVTPKPRRSDGHEQT